jgi:hypothetical protein
VTMIDALAFAGHNHFLACTELCIAPLYRGTADDSRVRGQGRQRVFYANARQNWSVAPPLETSCGPKPAKTLQRKAVGSIREVGIGEAKRKSQLIRDGKHCRAVLILKR